MSSAKLSGKGVQSFATRAVTLALSVPANVVLARTLLPGARGALAVVIGTAGIAVALGHCSIESSIPLQWRDTASRPSLRTNALVAGIALGSLAAVIAWFVVGALQIVPSQHRAALLIALVGVPLVACSLFLGILTILEGSIRRFDVARLAGGCFSLALLTALALGGRLNVASGAAVWTAVAFVQVALLVRRDDLRVSRASRAVLTRTVRDGLRYHPGVLMIFLLWRLDVLVLAALGSSTDVGLYALSVAIAEAVLVVSGVIGHIHMARQIDARYPDAHRHTWSVVRLTVFACAGVSALMAVSAPLFVPAVFGAPYAGSVAPLLALLPGMIAFGTMQPTTPLLMRQQRPGGIALACGVALAVNLALNVALIPRFGATGASLASSVTYVGLCATYLTMLGRVPRHTPDEPTDDGLAHLEAETGLAAGAFVTDK